MKKTTQIGLTGCALVFSLLLAGCSGGGAQIESSTSTVSHGQQLLDLKEARDQGVLSDDEYEDAKEEILDKI